MNSSIIYVTARSSPIYILLQLHMEILSAILCSYDELQNLVDLTCLIRYQRDLTKLWY
jgi:hypothetical protein